MASSTFKIGTWLQERLDRPKQPPNQHKILKLDQHVEVEISLPGSDSQIVASVHRDDIHLGLYIPELTVRLSQHPQLSLGGAYVGFDISLAKHGAAVLAVTDEGNMLLFDLKLASVVNPYTVAGTDSNVDRSLSLANARAWCTIPYRTLPINTTMKISVQKTGENTAQVDNLAAILAEVMASYDETLPAGSNELDVERLGENSVDNLTLKDVSVTSEQSALDLGHDEDLSTMYTITDEFPIIEKFRAAAIVASPVKTKPWCDFRPVTQQKRGRPTGARGYHSGRDSRGTRRGYRHSNTGYRNSRPKEPNPSYCGTSRGFPNFNRAEGQGKPRLNDAATNTAAIAGQGITAGDDCRSIDQWSREVAECWKPTTEVTGRSRAPEIKKSEPGRARFRPIDLDTVWKFLGVAEDIAISNNTKEKKESLPW